MTMLKCDFLLTICFKRLSKLDSRPRKSDFYGCMRTTGFHTWQRDHDKLNVQVCAEHKAKGNPALPLLPHTTKHRSTWDTAAKREIIQCDINYIYFQTWHSFRKSKLADARFADDEKQECFDILNDCRQWCAPRSAFSTRFRNILSALLWLSAWPTASPPQITFKVIVLFNISLTSASKIVATVTPEIIIFYQSFF